MLFPLLEVTPTHPPKGSLASYSSVHKCPFCLFALLRLHLPNTASPLSGFFSTALGILCKFTLNVTFSWCSVGLDYDYCTRGTSFHSALPCPDQTLEHTGA